MKPSDSTIAFMCLAATMLAGCLNLNKSYPDKRLFVVDVGPPPQETPMHSAIVLKINKLHVSPLFVGRAMVYRIADLQYESDFYDEWFIAPGALVTQQFQNWLSQSTGFQMVLMGTNHLEPTHLLEGTVTEFYGDFRGPPRAVLSLELHVLDAQHERQPLLRRTYHQEVPLAERSPEALARGLTDALRTVLVAFTKDIGEVETAP